MIGLNTLHWYHDFIYLCRLLTVVMGSSFAALLILNARRGWESLSRGEKYGFWTLLAYALNVVAFTAIVLADVVPKMPDSLIYIGWVMSFLLGYQMLYHSRRIR